ncbi:MAG: hypothetical protein QXZ36_03700 [Thermoproteota archaeon]
MDLGAPVTPIEEVKPKRGRKAKVTAPVISAENIAQLLILIDSIIAYSQPLQELRDLWDIPQEEVMLVAEPLAHWIGKKKPEVQEKLLERFDSLMIISAIFGVYGIRIMKHGQIVKDYKSRQATGYRYPEAREEPSNNSSGNFGRTNTTIDPLGTMGFYEPPAQNPD